MLLLTELDEIRYGLLEREDLTEMAEVIGAVFSRSDPLGVAAGMTEEELEAFVLVFGTKAVAEGLTIIAREPSGWLVGAMFSDDFATPPPELENLPVSFAPVGALLETLDEEYRHTLTIGVGSHAHLNMLAVLPAFTGMGIAQNLVRICMENAAKRGYRYAVTEANGPVSQHIFRKFGFREKFVVSYQDFRFADRPVFASIESTKGIMLMEADI
jgi:ribosomal protein S18 acetylase RimI-like enzyme